MCCQSVVESSNIRCSAPLCKLTLQHWAYSKGSACLRAGHEAEPKCCADPPQSRPCFLHKGLWQLSQGNRLLVPCHQQTVLGIGQHHLLHAAHNSSRAAQKGYGRQAMLRQMHRVTWP